MKENICHGKKNTFVNYMAWNNYLGQTFSLFIIKFKLFFGKEKKRAGKIILGISH